MEHFDCVVIGGGMVGAASALTLAQLGLRVAVVEKYQPKAFSPTQSVDLRVSAISLASENLLTQLGAWSQIAQWRLCPYKRLAVWECENAYTEFNALNIEQTHLGHIVENRLIQLALWQQMTSNHNIQLYCPESLTSLTQQSDKATLVLEQSTITANLVIGADGAQSKVRQMSGIGLTGWDYQQSAMLINVETQHPQQDITWQQYLPAGPVAFLPLSTPTTCDDKGEVSNQQMSGQASLVWYHNRDEIKRLSALSNKQLTQEILNTFPERLGNVNVIDKGAFALTRRHANTYQNKQVLLLGDAAHTINPMAGQGVNLGFKDVKALHEVIASAIAHNECWYAPEVLARYETLRRNDNLLMMSTMDALYTGFKHPSPLIKAARNLALLAINKVPVINSTVKNKALAYACGI
ncbi:FAD-dependent monooxygenase [Colwellia sp. D2M02]|uniref:FAD-dependent oxidoreductase n=1 Tax=Colwellia sp. D2M02 TaxID=2841562 RepID=UPI001C08BCD8|nr:FAD-dependent oxidoreductase [Colwellia sp. D2M02]MBU2893990.1 FAD-dependent monooxygenase [Colwellia sp. D2M02]